MTTDEALALLAEKGLRLSGLIQCEGWWEASVEAEDFLANSMGFSPADAIEKAVIEADSIRSYANQN